MAEVTEAHVTFSVCRGHGRSQIVQQAGAGPPLQTQV